MIIDVHSHYFPVRFLNELSARNITFGIKGAKFTVFDKMYDFETRFKDMETCDVDMQILSLGPRGSIYPGSQRVLVFY